MILIKNANLISMDEINYEITDILIENKVISKIGQIDESKYPNALVIDAAENYVTPGLVDPHCHIGLFEESIGFEGADGNEMTNPTTPELRAFDGIKPQDVAFKDALAAGVTTVCTGPGSANLIGGTFTILKTVGQTVDDMVVVKESSMKFALGENPKRVYKAQSKAPTTRMASAALIRETLLKAQEYRESQLEYEMNNKDEQEKNKPKVDLALASLARVFDGLPVKFHAHQQDDIVTAIRLIEEFNLNGTIDHGTESHLIADYLHKHNAKVILGPTLGSKSKYEIRNMTFKTAKVLAEKGVEFAIMTDHPVIHSANALTQVGLFVREGLPELEGLRAVTLYAAKLNNIDNKVGSITVGKDADIVIWDNHPLHYMTKPINVLIDGKVVYSRDDNVCY